MDLPTPNSRGMMFVWGTLCAVGIGAALFTSGIAATLCVAGGVAAGYQAFATYQAAHRPAAPEQLSAQDNAERLLKEAGHTPERTHQPEPASHQWQQKIETERHASHAVER